MARPVQEALFPGNKKLVREGKRDEHKGQFEGAVDDVKDAVKDVKHAANEAVK